MKSKLIFAIIIVALIFGGYWIINGPKKEVINKIQWVIDEETNAIVPIFLIHYKWNGIEKTDPTWMIFLKEGKWWVIDMRDMSHILVYSKDKSDFNEQLRKYWQEFTHSWIEKRMFDPKGSRYEAFMTAFGFQMIFDFEKSCFRDIPKGINDFKSGKLRPD